MKSDTALSMFNYYLSKYYTEDEGKSYYPCSKAFSQCEICNNNKNVCSKCYNGFFFIGLNEEKCETIYGPFSKC